MITLGIDPSLTGFGWCVHNGSVAGKGRVIAKGVFSTTTKRIIYSRYVLLRESLARLLGEYPEIQAVGVESPPFGESFSEGLYGLFLYVNEAVMQKRLDVVYFDPLRLKFIAKMDPSVRRGTMDKRDMVDAAKQDTDIKRWNHNEADAYLIARSAARFWDLYAGRIQPADLTQAEEATFRAIRPHGKQDGKPIGTGILFKPGDRFYPFSEMNPTEFEFEIPPLREKVKDGH